MKEVLFNRTAVGAGHPSYIIAEIGSNHNGDMDLCCRLIDAAAQAGAHAVKFQSWTESSLIANEEYERNTDYSDKKRHFGSLREMVQAYQFTAEQHRSAVAYCRERGIAFCSSSFSNAEVDLLDELDVPFFKLASMDIVNLPLISYTAQKGRPVVLSTGMATLAEIDRAVSTAQQAGNDQIVLLHCISIYPPEHRDIHLRNMQTLEVAFGLPVGFSDHSIGIAIPLAAIALGACVVEKHFTLDKDMPGWDHHVSADPAELAAIVSGGRNVYEALGSSVRTVSKAELDKRDRFRRSLVARTPLEAGHVLNEYDLDAKRPGTGISPDELPYVLGRKLSRAVAADQLIRWSDLQ